MIQHLTQCSSRPSHTMCQYPISPHKMPGQLISTILAVSYLQPAQSMAIQLRSGYFCHTPLQFKRINSLSEPSSWERKFKTGDGIHDAHIPVENCKHGLVVLVMTCNKCRTMERLAIFIFTVLIKPPKMKIPTNE